MFKSKKSRLVDVFIIAGCMYVSYIFFMVIIDLA